MIEGTWERIDRLQPFTLTALDGTALDGTALDGTVIALTPGRTWVELSRAGSTTRLL